MTIQPQIHLSYVVTTYNKLPYLKLVLAELMDQVLADEEIIVIDGHSSDGTPAYLAELLEAGKIHQFVSERDKGEAHGFNKGMLMARGSLIKIITDDDIFCYPAIRKCKEYMLLNKEVDFLLGNTAATYTKPFEVIVFSEYEEQFLLWKAGALKNFASCMTCCMIRKSSLALTGLLNSNCKVVDYEWTIRATALANPAWYTGFTVMNVINKDSTTSNKLFNEVIAPAEWARYVSFYNWNPPKRVMKNYPLLKPLQKIKLTRWKLERTVFKAKRSLKLGIYDVLVRLKVAKKKVPKIPQAGEVDIENIYREGLAWLQAKHQSDVPQFLTK